MRRAVMTIALMGCWATPPPAQPPSPRPREAPRPLPVTEGVRTARVRVDAATWIDIAIDGGEERAEVLCELAITEAIGQVAPEARVVRPCAAGPLPQLAARAGSALLVQREVVDEERFTIPLTARLAQPTGEQPAHGATTTYTWIPDRARCTRAADELRVTIEAVRREQAEAVRSFVSAQLDTARRDEATTCDEARNLAARCAQPLQPGMHGVCTTIAREAARGCQQAHDRVAVLERRLADPADVPATRTVRCD